MEDLIQKALYICDRCSHQWEARTNTKPKICPKCKRKDWNKGAKE